MGNFSEAVRRLPERGIIWWSGNRINLNQHSRDTYSDRLPSAGAQRLLTPVNVPSSGFPMRVLVEPEAAKGAAGKACSPREPGGKQKIAVFFMLHLCAFFFVFYIPQVF